MSKIDLVFLAILAFGAYSGYRKGFIAEVFFLLATITGILTAFHFSGDAGAWLKESLGWEHEFIQFAGFLFVFIIVLVLVSFMGKVLRSSIEKTLLGDFDRAFGAFIGVFKWGFLISVGL
ncbi:MAG TPA: CvpA family protein, partial [Cyclobacteriaceae bacterium]|nr:CvpA family protein [Cyclobacteriaceae bacterium]